MTNMYAKLAEDGTAVEVYNSESLKDTYTLELLGFEPGTGLNNRDVENRALTEYYTRMSSQPKFHLSPVWG